MNRIPDDKRFFRIGEASRIIGVEPYVLRYWESEFSQIKPRRSDSKHRTYRKKDLETLLEIKALLYEEKMTIEGAKQRLGYDKIGEKALNQTFIENIRSELLEIFRILS